MSMLSAVSVANGSSSTGQSLDRSAWLAERRKTIGASDVASILGMGFRTPFQVYLEKLGTLPEEAPSIRQRLGLYLEPFVLELYQEHTGAGECRTQQFMRSRKVPFLSATLDAVRSDGRPVELKTVGHEGDGWGEQGTDEVPEAYHLQCQVQAYVAEQEAVDLAALILPRGELRVYTIQRYEPLINAVLPALDAFWRGVERRTPPPLQGGDVDVLKLIHPRKGERVELSESVGEMAAEYIALGQEINRLEEMRGRYKANLMQALGTAEEGVTPEGYRAVRRVMAEATIQRKSYVSFNIYPPRKGKA